MLNLSILVTAFGSSNTRAIVNILQDRFPKFTVIAVDSNPIQELTPHPFVKNIYQVPQARNESYIEKLLEICTSKNVDFIIPVHDDEVIEISKHQSQFLEKGIYSFLSNIDTLEICRDKLLFYRFGIKNSLPVIDTFLEPNGDFPIFIKPRKGNGSQNCFTIYSDEEAKVFQKRIEDGIFQSLEVGQVMDVDFVADEESNILISVIKEELVTKDGIGVKVRICENEILEESLKHLVNKLQYIGVGAVEFFLNKDQVKIIEVNIRPSSGIIFSYMAGADLLGEFFLAAGYNEVRPKKSEIKIGARMNRELKAFDLSK